jgi:hypothetical protein
MEKRSRVIPNRLGVLNVGGREDEVTATAKQWLDRRGAKRYPARLCSAKLLDGRFKFSGDCLIRDESATGLRLLLVKRTRLPHKFALYDDQTKDVLRVAVVWQRGNTVGVKILSRNDDLLMTPAQRYALGGLYFGMRDED